MSVKPWPIWIARTPPLMEVLALSEATVSKDQPGARNYRQQLDEEEDTILTFEELELEQSSEYNKFIASIATRISSGFNRVEQRYLAVIYLTKEPVHLLPW